MSSSFLISGCTVLPMTGTQDGRQHFCGSAGFSGGVIEFVSDNPDEADEFRRRHDGNLTEIDGRGRLLMPGLINMHTHAAMTLLRSYADDIPLMPWLNERIWPFEARLNRDDIFTGARLGIAEMLLGGTTTFADMYWHEEAVAEAAEQMGIRAVLSPCFLDGRIEEFELDMQLTRQRAAGCDRLSTMAAPHAPYSCSPETLRRGLEIAARHEAGIHIHLAETLSEEQTIREKYGLSPVQYLLRQGVLDRPTIAAHLVHVSDEDIDILARKGVTAVHNPQSNMKMSSGISPAWEMARRGVNLCIGTDGVCSNNDLDMWEEMRTAALLQKVAGDDPCVMPAWEALKAVTVNAARALGMAGRTGELSPGAQADAILLDMQKPHLQPAHDIVATLVYCAKASDVQDVFVAGRHLVSGGQLAEFDTAALIAGVHECIAAIKSR